MRSNEVKKENLMLLFSFGGLLLAGTLIWILHQRVSYLENRECIIEVRILGAIHE
tara:strand:- start:48 stop:212 length:165 start_codon:yes stop_codon:yes gene_type:complete